MKDARDILTWYCTNNSEEIAGANLNSSVRFAPMNAVNKICSLLFANKNEMHA